MKILFLLFNLLIIQIASAKDIVVFYAKGDVKIIDLNLKERKALKGTTITEGEIIRTGSHSFVIVKINGHSIHRIEENTELTVSKLPYNFKDSDELEEGGSFYLKLGTIFSEVTQKADTNSLTIKTKNSAMGVRGTKLMVSQEKEALDTWVSVKEGVVEVKNDLSGDHDILLNKQSLVIETDKSFTKQKSYEWQNKLSWEIDKPIESSKSFKAQRKLARIEFRKKRTKWTRNEALFKTKMNEWKAKNERWKKRTQLLKENPQRAQRRKKLKEKIKENLKNKKLNKSTRQLYRGILNQDQDLSLNDFANRKLKKSSERVKLKRLQLEKLKRQRRRNNLPRPPLPGGQVGTAPTSNDGTTTSPNADGTIGTGQTTLPGIP